MTTTINASTVSGLVQTADTSGSLALQTASTTALTLDTSQNATFAGSVKTNTLTSAASTALTIQSAGTTAVTIDTSQNVGIGTTSPSNKLAVSQTVSGADAKVRFFNTATSASSASVVDISNDGDLKSAWRYNNNTGDTDFGNLLGAYNLKFYTNATERMRIDSSGNVGIGTTTPVLKLDVIGNLFVNNTGSTTARLLLRNSFTGAVSGGLDIQQISGDASINNATSGNMLFSTGNAERMRIDSSGNLLVATTSQIFSGKLCIAVNLNTFNPLSLQNTVTQGAGQSFMYMANSAGNKAGSIDHTGTTTVAYTTSSDYRMKENIAPMTGALNTVLQLKPCTYTWKEDGKAGQGFIAHELQAVVPDCVSGEKDAVDADGKPKYQGIDTSFLVATLTAAIQELKAINDTQAETINALTARIVALEAK